MATRNSPHDEADVEQIQVLSKHAATESALAGLYLDRPWVKHYDPIAAPAYPNSTLQAFLVDHATHYPQRPAISFYGRELSYEALEQATARFAALLAALGVAPGDRVALLLPNTPQFVIGFYGALRAGAIVVPTSPLYAEREIAHQLRDSGAKVLLTLTKFMSTVQAVRERTPLEHVLVTNIKQYFPWKLRLLFTLLKERKEGHHVVLPKDGRTHWLQDRLQRVAARAPLLTATPDDIALLEYTGGTTGTPKGAVLTHRSLVANLLMMRAWLSSLTPPQLGYFVTMGVVPLFHIYGLQTVMNLSIVTGGSMVLVPRFEPRMVLEAVQQHRPHLFPGVPTLYTALNNYPGVERFDLRSIQACISGAAPLPVEVKRRFEELTGGKLVEGYGLTEAAPVTHCNPLLGTNKAGSIGVPLPDTDAMIVDAETGAAALPVGAVGELIVRGPQVMRGYWQQPRESAAVLRDGWLFTGDLARMDEDGYFFIVDRKKDLIISGGMNVYPREVEEVLYELPYVKEAAVVGIPDAQCGEAVKVFIVLKEDARVTEAEIVSYCRRQLASYKVPKVVEFRPELPKTLVGKILRRVLQEESAQAPAQR